MGDEDGADDATNWMIPFDDIDFEVEIGHGSFGNVFRGSYLGTDVALKMLCQSDDPYVLHMAKREVQMLREVRHPNIMLTLGITKDYEETVYIVSEYVPEGNLRQFVKKNAKKITWKRKVSFSVDIAKAMVYLHARKIAHRDLKAKNFLIDSDMRVKLCDFGFAKDMSGQEGFATCCGTDSYVAPEVIMGMPYDVMCDVFSYGVVLFELICEKKPENNPNYRRISPTFGFDIVKLLNMIPEDCPRDFRDLAFECVLEDPIDRPTFKDVLKRLLQILKAAPDTCIGESEEEPEPRPPPKKQERREEPPPTERDGMGYSSKSPVAHAAQGYGKSAYGSPGGPDVPVKFSVNPAEFRIPVRFTWPEPADKAELYYKRIGKKDFSSIELPLVLATSDNRHTPLVPTGPESRKPSVASVPSEAFCSASVNLAAGQYVCYFVVDGREFVYPGVLMPKSEAIRFEVKACLDRKESAPGGLPEIEVSPSMQELMTTAKQRDSDEESGGEEGEGTVVWSHPKDRKEGEEGADEEDDIEVQLEHEISEMERIEKEREVLEERKKLEFPFAGERKDFRLIHLSGGGAGAKGVKRKQKVLLKVTRAVLQYSAGARVSTSFEYRAAFGAVKGFEIVSVPDEGVEIELDLGWYEMRTDANGRKCNLNGDRLYNDDGSPTAAPGTYYHVVTQIHPLPVAVHNEGWLLKEGARRKSWKKRYCVVEGRSMQYFKKKEDFPETPIDTIDVSEVMGSIQVWKKSNDSKKKNLFMIPTQSRNYYFACKDSHEVLAWIQKLRIAQASRISYWPF